MGCLRPPQKDIDLALEIEQNVPLEKRKFYLECMNNLPMSQRKTDQELRDGCILTHSIYLEYSK